MFDSDEQRMNRATVLYFKKLPLNFAASEEANYNVTGCIDHTLTHTNDLCLVITDPRVRFRISLCQIRGG